MCGRTAFRPPRLPPPPQPPASRLPLSASPRAALAHLNFLHRLLCLINFTLLSEFLRLDGQLLHLDKNFGEALAVRI